MSRIVKSSIIISGLTLASSVVSFLNQAVIASQFGTGKEMDTYLFLTSFPFLVSGVIGSSFSFSLVPHFVSKSYSYFRQFLYITTIIVFCLFVFFLAVYHYFVIDFFDLNKFPHIELLNLSVWLVFLLMIVFSVISCFFTSKSHFILPVVLNLLPFVCSILAIFLLKNIGTSSILIGLFGGYFAAIVYACLEIRKNHTLSSKSKNDRGEILAFFKSMRYSVFSMLAFSVFQLVDAYWGKKIGDSAISYLGYCQRIVIAVGALVISGPSSVMIPRLTTSYNDGNLPRYYMDTGTVIKLVFAFTSFAALIGSTFSFEIVSLMFQRGNFTVDSTKNVAVLLPYMLLGMVFMLCVVISFRSLFVQKITYKTSFIGVLTFMLYFTLSGILSSFFNIKGMGMAYIITWMAVFTITVYILFKSGASAFLKDFLAFLFKQMFTLMTVGAFLYLYLQLTLSLDAKFLGHGSLYVIVKLSVAGSVALLIYLLVGIKVMKMQELIYMSEKTPIISRWIM